MPTHQDLPATDSAATLHELIGDDATATFENDPKFIDGDAASTGSSENLEDPSDRDEIRGRPDLKANAAEADEDDDEEEDDEDDEDDEDEEDDDDDDEDLDDDEEEDEDEDEDEDDEEYEDDEDDEDDEDEDDADEVNASPALRARSLEGNALEADQDSGDVPASVDEDALDDEELDTDRITSPEGPVASASLEALRSGAAASEARQ